MNDLEALKAWAEKGPYHLQGQVDSYDTEGHGKTLEAALLSYAADCRATAETYERQSQMLIAEAKAAERAATACVTAPGAGGGDE